jgi:hypothetical protein
MVVVTIAIFTVVLAAVARLALAERRSLENRLWSIQAGWLAESALERAAARLTTTASYRGERWQVAADELDGRHAAVVLITVEPVPGQRDLRLVRAQADYPDHPQQRARQTRQAVVGVRR